MTLCEGDGIFLKNNFLFANGSVKSLYFGRNAVEMFSF